MTQEQISYEIGFWIGIGAIISLVIWGIWTLVKYKPFSVFVKMLYDIRKFVVQVIYMYSNKPSFFSKKRFESGAILYWSLIMATFFVWYNRHTLPTLELMAILGPFLIAAGFDIYHTQKEKIMNINNDTDNTNDDVKK